MSPKKEPKAPPTQIEEKIAIYLQHYVCMIPGCDHKMHLEDAKNIISILKKEVE